MFSDNFQEAELSDINLSEEVEAQAVVKLMNFIYKGTLEGIAACGCVVGFFGGGGGGDCNEFSFSAL